MFDENFIDEIMQKAYSRKREKGASFLNVLRGQFLKDTEENISRIFTRDKMNFTFKLCKMKSGRFSIIDNVSQETLFSSYNLHEAKVECIVMNSVTDGGIGSKIFDKAMNL